MEVEIQERIDIALSGFGLPSEAAKSKRTKDKAATTGEPASASALLTKEERPQQCVFCRGNHESPDCDVARKMTLSERRDSVKWEGACFSCLKRGHIAEKCRVRAKCSWCGRKQNDSK